MPKPFLKWAGGKASLVNQIKAHFPVHFPENYVEPFLGGGAMFFYLFKHYKFKTITLSDVSKDLIKWYEMV